jgi:hypothetical protein
VVLFKRGLSKYAKSILECTENTLKEYKRTRRICQEYFAVYREYADRHETESISVNFWPKPKKCHIINHLPRHDLLGKRTISRYCPFKSTLWGLLLALLKKNNLTLFDLSWLRYFAYLTFLAASLCLLHINNYLFSVGFPLIYHLRAITGQWNPFYRSVAKIITLFLQYNITNSLDWSVLNAESIGCRFILYLLLTAFESQTCILCM